MPNIRKTICEFFYFFYLDLIIAFKFCKNHFKKKITK